MGIIRKFIDSQKKEGLLVMTDPIMGDDGKLYNGVTEETVENMRHLIGVADVIVPNLTEAEMLTGLQVGKEDLTEGQTREIVDALLAYGPRSVVITSGIASESGEHVVWGYDHGRAEYFMIPYRFIRVHFPGTGDMFSAILVGELLEGKPLQPAVKRAMDMLERLIFLERDELESASSAGCGSKRPAGRPCALPGKPAAGAKRRFPGSAEKKTGNREMKGDCCHAVSPGR